MLMCVTSYVLGEIWLSFGLLSRICRSLQPTCQMRKVVNFAESLRGHIDEVGHKIMLHILGSGDGTADRRVWRCRHLVFTHLCRVFSTLENRRGCKLSTHQSDKVYVAARAQMIPCVSDQMQTLSRTQVREWPGRNCQRKMKRSTRYGCNDNVFWYYLVYESGQGRKVCLR